MKNKNISDSMKDFWEKKGKDFLDNTNKKRSESLKSQCIWLKKDNLKPFPCNIELLLVKLSEGYLIVNTEKNREKVYNFFGEVPDFFWADKKSKK